MEVRDLSAKHRKVIASLSRKKGRLQHGLALIEGFRAVVSAVRGGAPLVEILATEQALAFPPVRLLIQDAGVPVVRLSDRDAGALSTVENDQGILALTAIQPALPADLYPLHRILALNSVQDPGNVGTIVRTAAWFGLDAVLAGPGTADFYNPKVMRASMGGLWDLRVARSEALAEDLNVFKARGFRVYGADLNGISADLWEPETPCLLILGSEASGIAVDVRTLIDQFVTVRGRQGPMATESLNVATAAGILIHRWVG